MSGFSKSKRDRKKECCFRDEMVWGFTVCCVCVCVETVCVLWFGKSYDSDLMQCLIAMGNTHLNVHKQNATYCVFWQ